MFALDLFNIDYERRLAEGAVDQLEQRRIDDLAMKMDDLVARAKQVKDPEHKVALVKEFQKVKAERDSYYHVREDGIGHDIANKAEKIARATPSTPAGQVASTVKNAAKWLAGKGGPGKEGPTYESQKKSSETVDESQMAELDAMRQDLEGMSERQFYTAYGISKAAFQQKYRTLLKPTLDEDQRLHVGDPVVVTAPNEFEGKTGEVSEFSPSGKFVVVDLYNHGKHSMHLSDVEYNQYADDQAEEDDWYDDQEDTMEGFQDFNKVEPYAVCLAGKPVKKFDYYEQARRFHDNWKQKLYREGNKEKADKITLMPLNLDEAGNPAQQAAIAIAMKKAGKKPKQVDELDANTLKSYADKRGAQVAAMKADNPDAPAGSPEWIKAAVPGIQVARAKQKIARKERQAGVTEDTGSWIVYDPETKQIKKRFKTYTAGKSYAKTHGLGFASSEYYFDRVKEKAVAEAQTDYQKRRQRERDVDAGRPVKPLPRNPQTDYARKRAKDKRDMELGEDEVDDFVKAGGKITYGKPQKGPRRPGLSLASRHIGGGGDKMKPSRTGRAGATVGGKPVGIKEEQDNSGVERAILNRIMVAHTDLLKQFGPQKVMQAADEVAYNVGDVDEIGTSDVSAYVNQVRQILGA